MSPTKLQKFAALKDNNSSCDLADQNLSDRAIAIAFNPETFPTNNLKFFYRCMGGAWGRQFLLKTSYFMPLCFTLPKSGDRTPTRYFICGRCLLNYWTNVGKFESPTNLDLCTVIGWLSLLKTIVFSTFVLSSADSTKSI